MVRDSAGPPEGVGARWSAARSIAGYGAALSMGSYLVVKVVWIGAALIGRAPEGFGTAGWALLNTVTVVMALAGVGLGLALARPWGRRLPAVPVVLFSWVGAGFMVPVIPYMLIRSVLGALGVGGGGGGDDAGAAPQWEMILITVGFGGMALGLTVALPIYLRERWPRFFTGRLGDGRAGSSSLVPVVIAGAVALGVLWLFWAVGGTVGLDPAHRDLVDLNGRLLCGNSGLWALLGAWSVGVLARRRPARLPLWIPTTLGLVASGSLFAWSGWKLPMVILRPGGFAVAEYPAVAVAEHALAIGVGLALLAAIIRAVRTDGPVRSGPADTFKIVNSR